MTRDLALIERLERLYPAVVADCLDRLGARAQVLEPHIRPLYTEAKVAGFAATVQTTAWGPEVRLQIPNRAGPRRVPTDEPPCVATLAGWVS
jgi:hypothetical protein